MLDGRAHRGGGPAAARRPSSRRAAESGARVGKSRPAQLLTPAPKAVDKMRNAVMVPTLGRRRRRRRQERVAHGGPGRGTWSERCTSTHTSCSGARSSASCRYDGRGRRRADDADADPALRRQAGGGDLERSRRRRGDAPVRGRRAPAQSGRSTYARRLDGDRLGADGLPRRLPAQTDGQSKSAQTNIETLSAPRCSSARRRWRCATCWTAARPGTARRRPRDRDPPRPDRRDRHDRGPDRRA